MKKLIIITLLVLIACIVYVARAFAETHTYIVEGRMVTCTTFGNITNCF